MCVPNQELVTVAAGRRRLSTGATVTLSAGVQLDQALPVPRAKTQRLKRCREPVPAALQEGRRVPEH